jgi:hypothetical protein
VTGVAVRRNRRQRTARAVRLAVFAPPYALALAALFEPWARARVTLLWGVSRSPEAALLLAGALAAALALGVFAAWSGRGLLAASLHLAAGLGLGFVAYQAYGMVQEAGVRAFWLLPIVSVRPGRGLTWFALAAASLILVGLVEAALALWRHRSTARATPVPGGEDAAS